MNAATVIAKIYREYAAKLAKGGTHLDIDVPDPSVKIERPAKIAKMTEAYLDFCLKNPAKSNVALAINRGKFYIKDDTRLLKPDEKAIFEAVATTSHIEAMIRSRLGYGTTVSLDLG